MDELNEWEKLIIKTIISNQNIEIKEVTGFELIKSLFFEQKEYSSIVSLIKRNDWESLNSLVMTEKSGFREYLEIVRFSNQEGKAFVATLYDSDELWQDPQIIDIFPSNEPD